MSIQAWTVAGFLVVGMWLSVKAGKLTILGALTGGILGWAIYSGAGLMGLSMLGAFFVLGSLVSSFRFSDKAALGLAEANKGRRKASQALANGGVAGLMGLLSWAYPARTELFQLMLAASFASATADTFASELGNIYGRSYYNILTLKPDTRGLDGVISLEGTLAGIGGSSIITALYIIGQGWSPLAVVVWGAGILGNLADSVLGAAWERKAYLSNDAVNFLNTLIAALIAGALYLLLV
ncbi:DUF92 domain-containing protein [Siphonobacter sp. BAB-5405]|uniref:DUF92 domain-containing protein n=1 Tax=Siphonobacter sp. BAB-5405 TaxID=1864825 RepID=UPI0018EC1BAB|nr:DUF92 domain-containing protein [Siphonobacter sp. BAB-5405]